MINNELTYNKFGYYVNNLNPSSHKKIIATCDNCGLNRVLEYRIYRSICKKCANSLLKGSKNPNFKGGKPKCIDCGKEISYYCKRCKSCSKKGKKNNMYGKLTHGKWQHFKGSYMRSSWEVTYAKYCLRNKIKYRYESKTFEITYFYNNKKKIGTYTPDFYLPEKDLYIEIKGYWRDDAKVKFDTFKKQYPNIKIKLIKEVDNIL